MRCPNCDSEMEKQTGTIHEPVMKTGTGAIERRARLATFWACPSCEHCEEWKRGNR